ncbi:UPF0606 protein KIAA1549L homolog isoform X2 [Hemicordylus capensis]|uniref:UPF0606 protein KIAA1549L homolog isoform X2 n=1 Tax=Hemicordylus capensis TaxID=884348 RepID=UPI002302E708|nr:UPF0606 protein KIAA1549L homolog isoform X2 [Hemicordylus capensis]
MALSEEAAAAPTAPRCEPPVRLLGFLAAGISRAWAASAPLRLLPLPCPEPRSARTAAAAAGGKGPLFKAAMLLGVLLLLCQRVQAEQGTEQQQLNVAPSSESFTNWRAILSPTWPSRELESSSVGDISMRQALENANLLQIIKSTLAGTRTRTMDQTRFLPSLYQGSGNSASQEPPEVSAESPMRSQDADELAIVSGLPQIHVFSSALSTSPSVTRSATTVSSQIMPYTTSSISKEITSGSDIFSTSPSPPPLPLATESPHVIIVSKLTEPPIKVPSFTDTEHSFNINTAKFYFNKSAKTPRSTIIAGNSSTTEYTLSRKGGKEFSVATSLSNNFGLMRGHPIIPAERHTHPGSRKLNSPALHAIIPNQTSIFLSTKGVPLNVSKKNAFPGLIKKASSVAALTSQPRNAMIPYRETNDYATVSSPVLTSKTAIPWISTSTLHISSIPSVLVKILTSLPTASLSESTKEIPLLSTSESPTILSHLMKNVSSSTLPTLVISEAMNVNNAITQVPAPESPPVSYSTDKATSLIVRINRASIAATHTTDSAPNDKVISEIHLTDSHVTKGTSDIASETSATAPPTASEAPLWSHNYSLVRSLQRRSFAKDTTAKMFPNTDTNTVLPYQSPGTQTTNSGLEMSVGKETPWRTMLERILSVEGTSTTAFSVSLPTSIGGPMKSYSAATSISSPSYSRNVQLSTSIMQNPPVRLTEEEGGNAKILTTVTPQTEHLLHPSLNKSDAKLDVLLHMTEASSQSNIVPLGIYALPSFTPALEPLGSPAPSSLEVSNATSKSTPDTSNTGRNFQPTASTSEWNTGGWQFSPGISVSSGKRTSQIFQNAKDHAKSIALKTVSSEVPDLQQQTNYANKHMPSSSETSSIASVHNISTSSFTTTKSNRFTDFNTHSFAMEKTFDKYSSLPQSQRTLSKSTEVVSLQSKKGINTPGNVLEYFTMGNSFTSNSGKKTHPTPKELTAANAGISPSMDAFFLHFSMYSHSQPSASYASSQTMLKPQATNSVDLFVSYTTSSPPASQFIAKLTGLANDKISSFSRTTARVAPIPGHEMLNSTSVLNLTEEYMTLGKPTQFTNHPFSETNNHLSKHPSAFSTGGWHTEGTRGISDTTKVPVEATRVTPLQTHTTSALQSAIITSVHASPTQLTSPLLPTTNFTHSVITVLPPVSPGVIPSVATSEATPVTGKSAPTSPMLTSSLFSLSTENSPSVMALSTLISTLAKNNTATKMAPTVSPVVTHAVFPVVSRDKSTTPVHTTSSFPLTKTSTVSAPTTQASPPTETTVLDTKKSTSSDITKTSTAYPLTITAALTSITASAKTTRLLPTPAENTSAAAATTTAPVSTAAFANVTTALPLECQLSRNLLIKTVLLLNTRKLLLSDSLKQNVTKGLTQALQQAFNQNVNAQVEILEQSNNVTVGYYVTQERLVFIPSVVIDMLIAYGVSNATLDIKQHVPNLHSVAVLALPWNPLPAYHFQLKTELQFVGQSENIQSCSFVQTMEQRLQKAFQDAERKVLNTSNKLTVQILNTSNVSQAVTLFYVVRNESTVLNGTVSSNLLNHLSAELVGFYLTYPPLTIAEALEYPNLDISEATRDYWVITVIQGVGITLLGVNNQSFARLMEQRLAPLFMMSHQQGRRFKRATTVGSYTVQMVKMQRIPGPKEPAELTYYTLYNGKPLLGTTAAKILSTVDSQRMALTVGYVVQVQADPVVKNPPNNLWIIAAVLAPIAVVTVIIIIITAVLCRKNKNDFKADTMMNLPQRAKPVQGFDYAKQHLGQQGAEDEVLPVTQETVVLPLPMRDASASQEREIIQDGSTAKTAKSNDTRKSRSPSENGSVISNESGKPNSSRGSPQKVMAQQKVTKEEGRKRNVPISDEEEGGMFFDNVAKSAIDPFDTSSGSVQLIAIKPVALPPAHPTSDRSQETAILNGEVNKALKQKSDIEHYRNKLRLKAKRKGYYDFPQVDNNALAERKKMYEKAQNEIDRILDPDTDGSSPFVEPKNRQQMKNSVYRSRQSLNSPSPGETEMDLLVTRERQRRGIRNSGYDTEPEMIEETNVDRVNEPRNYTRTHQAKGHSETSTLSSQPSIDEVRQQMHMLLEEAFSLASAGHGGQGRQQDAYSSTQHLPYSDVVTSAPGTMSRPRGGIQWVPTYRPEMYQYSLPRPAYRFSPLPEMVMGSPPPPVPPRTGPVAVTSLRRSTSDIGSKTRMSESSGTEQIQPHDHAPFVPVSRAPVSVAPLDQSALNYSGSTVPAVFAIPAAHRPGFTGYFIPTPPTAYRNQAWMSYAGENDLPGQWADSVPLPGYIEAYSRPRYQHNSPSRLPRQYSQPANMHPSLEQAPLPSTAASQQSLTENDSSDNPLSSLSTAALVKAIREEVAKLAKKQTDMFEFQV